MTLPNATELRNIAKQAREAKHQAWIDDIKQSVINKGNEGFQSRVVEDPYCGEYSQEIRDIFEPLGYNVRFESMEALNGEVKDYIIITW